MIMTPPRQSYFAPGKLMIAGEYSVLSDQGSALALAVPQGILCDAGNSR